MVEHGSESIRFRTYRDLAPPGYADRATLAEAQQAVAASKLVNAVTKKQKPTGIFGTTFFGPIAPGVQGAKDPGMVAQYRRLIELGMATSSRPFKLADRVFFRLLSRDPDPALLFEFRSPSKDDAAAQEWARDRIREAASAALAEGGHSTDPRLRGSAHRIASAISQFLRSPLADKPFAKAGSKTILDPDAYPPTWYSLAMLAAMPSLQRERAGFKERLGAYLAKPTPKKAYVIQIGKRSLKSRALLLGDPIEADRQGNAKDIPLALHYLEMLARIDALDASPVATRVLGRLLKDCNEDGIWHPKNLRSRPKAAHKISYHAFPLSPPGKSLESRQVDITFRLGLIAKQLGWEIDYS